MNLTIPKIYPITDRKLSGLSHAEQTKELIAGGAKLIQLREKSNDMRTFCEDVSEAVKYAHSHGGLILVNDRVDVAMLTGADGVHLGQNDLPVTQARRLLGSEKIIGLSTHNLEQAKAAMALPVDYIAVGPIFETGTKSDHEPPIGLSGLMEVKKTVGCRPLVAIGGINSANLCRVLDHGADSAAMISELYRERAPASEKLTHLFSLLANNSVAHR